MKRAVWMCLISVMMLFPCVACGQPAQMASETVTPQNTPGIIQNSLPPTPTISPAPTVSIEPSATATAQPDNGFVFPFSSIDLLDADAQLVFTGEGISAEPIFQNDTLYTLSQIKVDHVFKGDISAGDILFFGEYGGRVTNGEYNKGCNLPPIPEKGQATVNDMIEVGLDGYYPFQQGERALVFAVDISGFLEDVDESLYGPVGGYYGKLLIRDHGTYARPQSATDKDIYIDSYVLSMDELKKYYQK